MTANGDDHKSAIVFTGRARYKPLVIRIGFYGRLAERFGREIELDLPAGRATVAALRAQFEGLDAATVRALVNDESAGEDSLVEAGDRVDFLPPLSGG